MAEAASATWKSKAECEEGLRKRAQKEAEESQQKAKHEVTWRRRLDVRREDPIGRESGHSSSNPL